MRALKAIVVILVVALGFLGGYFAGWFLHGENQPLAPALSSDGSALNSSSNMQKSIVKQLQGRYYKKVSIEELSQAGIRGMLESLDDPYTVYLSPEEMKAFEEKQKGEYSGIGAALQKEKAGLVVTRVFPGSPAEKAGVKSGDIILTVDGRSTADVDIDTSISHIKGRAGTVVELKLRSGKAERAVKVERQRIEIPTTEKKIFTINKRKIGYIQLYEFGGNAARDVRRDVKSLSAEGAEAFILDLRYNPGGLLSQAVDVTGVFETGSVVSTEGLHSPREVLTTDGPVATDKPLVVLVNKYSASASEIVTGALNDSDRATIVGGTTYGKGLVQTIIDLDGGAALKLTTAEYRTPAGTDINKKGIKPDVVVKDLPKARGDEQRRRAFQILSAELAK